MWLPPRLYRVSAAWMAIVALGVLSLLPKEDMVRTSLGGHLEHIFAYAGTACVVASAYGVANSLTIGAGLIAYAGILEMLQRFSPGRTPAIEDFACSTAGVLLGIALFALIDRLAAAARRGCKRRATHEGSGARTTTAPHADGGG
jgi:VanZ family protein